MFVRIESVVGMIAAAPTPIRAREAISSVELPEMAASSEPAPKIASPTISAFLRPKRSPRLPAISSRTGEHEQVAVDDPLQLARARVELRRGSSAARR